MRYMQRRRLCRVVFCLLCALPTLLILGTAAVRSTPAYRTYRQRCWHQQMTARLGLEMEYAECREVATRQWVLRRVQLRDPESQATLATIRSVSVTSLASGWQIELGQGELDAARLPRLVEILHEHLLQRGAAAESGELAASTLLLRGDPYLESLLDCRLVWQTAADLSEVFVEFHPAAHDQDEPVRLRVVRNRQIEPAATGWELHCDATPLPCQLARAWLPQLESLGAECQFRGSIWSERLAGGWEAQLTGDFCRVDLDCLVSQQFSHKLSGVATLSVQEMLVRQGRLVQLRGCLESAGGTVGQSLLEAAETHLRLQRCTPATDSPRLAYRDLWCDFVLDESGLLFAGRDDLTHTVMADSRGPLLTAPAPVRVPPHAIVRALVPLADYEVPATVETTALLRTLPLPSANPRAASTARQGAGPLRLIVQ